MSETPRTNERVEYIMPRGQEAHGSFMVMADFARTLERELRQTQLYAKEQNELAGEYERRFQTCSREADAVRTQLSERDAELQAANEKLKKWRACAERLHKGLSIWTNAAGKHAPMKDIVALTEYETLTQLQQP